MFGRGMGETYAVFLLPLEREFHWTRSDVTSVYSIYLLVNGFTAPLVGLVFDRLGPRWVYGAGLACLGSAFFLAGGLTSLWQFYLLIGVLVGLGVSLNGMVPGSALLARWYRERLSTAIGIAFSAVGVGTVVFVPLAQYLITDYDWRTAYRVLGGVILALVPVVILVVPWRTFAGGDTRHRHDTRHKKPGEGWTPRTAIRTPVFWGLGAVFFFTAIAMFTVIVQLVAFFIDVGFSPLAAATAYGLLGLLSAFSVMASGLLSERFGYRQTVTASFAGTALGMLLLFLLTAPSSFLLGAFVVVFGLCMGTRGPIISSVSARFFAGPNVATIYGSIYATNALGAAAGALLGGFLHDLTGGYRVGFAVALVFIVLAATPFWIVRELRTFR